MWYDDQSSNMEQVITSELKISEDEAKVYIAIVKKGKMDPAKISIALGETSSVRLLWQNHWLTEAWSLK